MKMETEMKTLDHYKALPYRRRVELVREADGQEYFVASVVELPGVEADGSTPYEAHFHLQHAFEDYLIAMLKWGEEIPEPELEIIPADGRPNAG